MTDIKEITTIRIEDIHIGGDHDFFDEQVNHLLKEGWRLLDCNVKSDDEGKRFYTAILGKTDV